MSKLLRANFCRLSKDVLFYIVVLVNTVLTILFANDLYRHGNVESFYLTIQPIIYSVFVAFYVGKEYGNGTIRNKLVCGHTRSSLYLSYLITCIAATLISIIPGIIILCIWNIKFFSAIKLSVAILILLGYLLLHCACCALFVAVGFIIPSKAVCVVVVILVAFMMIFLSEYSTEALSESKTLSEVVFNADGTQTIIKGEKENPDYVDGLARTVLYRAQEFIPSAQVAEYGNLLSIWRVAWEGTQTIDTTDCDMVFKDSNTVMQDIQYRFFLNQMALIIISTLGGCLLFRRKNLK